MAKLRETCTACSLRRQKCDRQTPCNRCVKRGQPESCTKEWPAESSQTTRRTTARNATSTRSVSATPLPRDDGSAAEPAISQDDGQQQGGIGDLLTPTWFYDNVQAESAFRFSDLDNFYSAEAGAQQPELDPFQQQAPIETSRARNANQTPNPAIAVLQLQLPSVDKIWSLVDFHEKALLWYHSSYHGPTFRRELEGAMSDADDTVDLAGLNLQWVALLFSIMAGSLACASGHMLEDWGFDQAEAARLSGHWYKATITCLNASEYTTDHHIYTVNAISTLTMSAHSLGLSTELSILLGAALMIAKSLGLGSLSYNRRLEHITPSSSPADRQYVLHRDIGRRAWSQLCVQDWLSLPFWESYSINPRHFSSASAKPGHRDHLSMEPIADTYPVYVSYGNFLFDIAKLMAEHHDASVQSSTVFTQYEKVLEFDGKMRRLATKGMPGYFHVTQDIDSSWPGWIPWARQSLTICCSHKIIMIHRNFIGRSFKDPNFAMTRKTCIAASKTILREARHTQSSEGPTIWIDKAFSIVAAITLCVDLFHGSESGGDYELHRSLVVDCIDMLSSFCYSVIAVKGANLLAALLRVTERRASKRSHSEIDQVGSESLVKEQVNLSAVVRALDVSIDDGVVQLAPEVQVRCRGMAGADADVERETDSGDTTDYRDYPELFPPQAGFCNRFLFERLMVFGS